MTCLVLTDWIFSRSRFSTTLLGLLKYTIYAHRRKNTKLCPTSEPANSFYLQTIIVVLIYLFFSSFSEALLDSDRVHIVCHCRYWLVSVPQGLSHGGGIPELEDFTATDSVHVYS